MLSAAVVTGALWVSNVKMHVFSCRWSFLIGDEPCTVVNKPPKAPSPVLEEIEEVEQPQVEVIIEEFQDEKEEEQEKADVESTKVGDFHCYELVLSYLFIYYYTFFVI